MQNESSKSGLDLIINGKPFKWHQEYIQGIEIKDIGGVAPETPLFLEVEKPWEDELIHNDTRVNLARPGIEQFTSKERHPETVVLTIITPKGNWQHAVFHNSLTVSELIQKIIRKFKFEADGNYGVKITGPNPFLEGSVTLGSLHLPDCSSLTFSDLGKGASL